MDAFAQWKQEVDAEQDRLENTGQQLSEEEQLRRIDMYWVSVVRDIKPDDPNAFRKIQTIRRFANRAGGEYPLTYAALRSLPPLDNAPSLARMRREIDEAANDLRRRNPSSTSHDLVDMMDGKLTNYISDLRKDDPKYEKKIDYFKDLLLTGMLPNATATFERKGHGKVDVPGHMEPEQPYEGRVLPPYVSNGGKKKKTLKRRHRKIRKTRRRRS
jgi:hypothetical protein